MTEDRWSNILIWSLRFGNNLLKEEDTSTYSQESKFVLISNKDWFSDFPAEITIIWQD